MAGIERGGVLGGGQIDPQPIECLSTACTQVLHMRFWPLTAAKKPDSTMASDLEAALARLHRLEIANNQLRERLDDLEGRHASLSAQIRGRMGGRPQKNPAQLGIVPLGAQHLLNQER